VLSRVPCAAVGINSPEVLLTIIDNAGLARFCEKAARFHYYLQRQDPGQALYSGIMTALGYARNKEPFRKLAEKVLLCVLESMVRENSQDESGLVLLLGIAGLLPSQRPQIDYSPFEDYAYVNELERIWERMQRIDVMAYADWQPFRVRPSNSPLRRIAGMCHLIRRYRTKGLLDELVELVRDCPKEKASQYLAPALMAADDGYWSSRYEFGKGYSGLSKWLIGQSRAADIVINVLLPFIYTWDKDNGRRELVEKALTVFRTYPAVETNTLERHMRAQFGLKSLQVNSAQRQQGLLHLYKKWCTQGRCKECEVAGIGKFQQPKTKYQTMRKDTINKNQVSSVERY
jgi:hypothetical protein